MTKQMMVALAAAALFTAGGWALAQPGAVFPGKTGPEGPNRYAVSASGTSAVMVDTATGRSWVLQHGADLSSTAWLPVVRIDAVDEAAAWSKIQDFTRRERSTDAKGERIK